MKGDVGAILLAVPILAAGAFLLLQATGSQSVCFTNAPCAPLTDAREPWRPGGALLALMAGFALLLTGLWR